MIDGIRVAVELPPETVERIVVEVVRRLRGEERPPARWLYGAAGAAEYLGWPLARVYRSLPQLPHGRDGRRLVFNTEQLDRYLAGGYEGPALFSTVARPHRCPTQSEKKEIR